MSNVDFASFHTIDPCWLLFEYACVSSSLVSAVIVIMVVYLCVGRRFQNKGEVLLGYGRVCFGAFKFPYKISIYQEKMNQKGTEAKSVLVSDTEQITLFTFSGYSPKWH